MKNESVVATSQRAASAKGNRAWVRKLGIVVSLLALFIFFACMSEKFLSASNLTNILVQSSINGVIALGMTLVIITGGIDLSVGSIVALSAMTAAMMMASGLSPAIALVTAVALGVVCGVANGLLISLLGLQPFLVTLGTMSIYRGITLIMSDGLPVRGLSQEFLKAMNSLNTSVPVPVILLLVLAVAFGIILKWTPYGQYLFAVGGNEEAARFSCVNVSAVKTTTYALSGLACAIAAIIYMGRLAAADPQTGDGYELNAIASAAIGGASLAGGRGSLVGTIIGALILGTLSNGLILMNVQSFYQTLFVGIIIIVATTIDRFSNR